MTENNSLKKIKANAMKSAKLIVYISVAVSLLTGIYLSFDRQDYVWFSRFGAIIAIMPILLTVLKDLENTQMAYFRKHCLTVPGADDDQKKSEEYFPWEEIVQAFIIVLGTIIWGFGDIMLLSLFGPFEDA